MNKVDIEETIKDSHKYLKSLQNLNDEIIKAQKQVLDTYTETRLNISNSFNKLREHFLTILSTKETQLLEQALKIKDDSLLPLEQCLVDINEKIQKTNDLIKMGHDLLTEPNNSCHGNGDCYAHFDRKSSRLGNLPEVPELHQVASISLQVQDEAVWRENLTEFCQSFAKISRIAPVQITEAYEKPGALLVEWEDSNATCDFDIQCFRLQKAFGNLEKEPHLEANFHDCYRGLETQFLVKDLQPEQFYTLRVCCKYEGATGWSPWSIWKVAQTTLAPFQWECNEDFEVTGENKIARPLHHKGGILYSQMALFAPANALEFTFLEIDENSDFLIGLVGEKVSDLKKATNHCLVLGKSGKICIDGSEKSTVLPTDGKSIKIGFTCDPVDFKGRVRIHVDANDKRVTYDWNFDRSLYFAVQFLSEKWKIMVE